MLLAMATANFYMVPVERALSMIRWAGFTAMEGCRLAKERAQGYLRIAQRTE